jgi:hypothetical protein
MSRDFLRANTGVQDPLWHNVANNPFFPRDWETMNMFIFDRHDLNPDVQGQSFGGTVDFTFKKTSDLIGIVRFRGTVSAITPGTTTDANPQFCDWLGANLVSQCQVTYGGNNLQQFNSDSILEEIFYEHDEQQVRQYAQLMIGQKSVASREALGLAAQNFDVQLLPLFWGHAVNNWMPINVLGDDLHLSITLPDVAKVLQVDPLATAGTITASLSNLKLNILDVHLTPEDRKKYQLMAHSGDGILYKFIDEERQKFTVPVSTTTQDLILTALRSPGQDLRIKCRKATEETTNNQIDPTNYQRIDFITINANGQDLHKRVSHDELVYHWWMLYHKGPVGQNLYSLPNSLDPDNHSHNSGSINYGNLSQPTITVEWTVATAVAQIVTVILRTPNIIQCRMGDLIKVFK